MKKGILLSFLVLSFLNVFSQENNIEELENDIKNILKEKSFIFQPESKEKITHGYFYSKGTTDAYFHEYFNGSLKKKIEVYKYQYDSSFEVEKICNELKSSKDISLHIGKEFHLILFIDNSIYEIYAPCSFSSKVWKDIIKGMKKLDKQYDNRIACICGGACNLN